MSFDNSLFKEELEKFKNSGQTFTSRDIGEIFQDLENLLIESWLTSLSEDGEGRDALYRQVRGNRALFLRFAGWSKK